MVSELEERKLIAALAGHKRSCGVVDEMARVLMAEPLRPRLRKEAVAGETCSLCAWIEQQLERTIEREEPWSKVWYLSRKADDSFLGFKTWRHQ
jgi:hypothetical protein